MKYFIAVLLVAVTVRIFFVICLNLFKFCVRLKKKKILTIQLDHGFFFLFLRSLLQLSGKFKLPKILPPTVQSAPHNYLSQKTKSTNIRNGISPTMRRLNATSSASLAKWVCSMKRTASILNIWLNNWAKVKMKQPFDQKL